LRIAFLNFSDGFSAGVGLDGGTPETVSPIDRNRKLIVHQSVYSFFLSSKNNAPFQHEIPV
jgi:hypothetical protein